MTNKEEGWSHWSFSAKKEISRVEDKGIARVPTEVASVVEVTERL
jgi:hypothetical protein